MVLQLQLLDKMYHQLVLILKCQLNCWFCNRRWPRRWNHWHGARACVHVLSWWHTRDCCLFSNSPSVLLCVWQYFIWLRFEIKPFCFTTSAVCTSLNIAFTEWVIVSHAFFFLLFYIHYWHYYIWQLIWCPLPAAIPPLQNYWGSFTIWSPVLHPL